MTGYGIWIRVRVERRSARNNHRDSEDTEGSQRLDFIRKTLCATSVSPAPLWLLRRQTPRRYWMG